MVYNAREQQFYDDLKWYRDWLLRELPRGSAVRQEVPDRYKRMRASFHEQTFTFANRGGDD